MTLDDILENAGLGHFSLWDKTKTPFLMRLKNGEFVGDLYFYLTDPDDEYKPNMCRVKNNEVVEFYEVYKNPDYYRANDFTEFGLNIDDYDMHQYSLRRTLPEKEKLELYIDEIGKEFFMRIDKESNIQYYKSVFRSDEDPLFEDIFDKYAINSLVAYYDGEKNYTGVCTIMVSSDLDCYKEYKENLDIDFTF